MSSQSLSHITTDGERWDSLAWTYYGDATLDSFIIMANPNVTIEPTLAAGIQLFIPIVQVAATSNAVVPPWRRVQ